MADAGRKIGTSTLGYNLGDGLKQLRDETARILENGEVTNGEVRQFELLRDSVVPLFAAVAQEKEFAIVRDERMPAQGKDPATMKRSVYSGRGEVESIGDQVELSRLRGAEYHVRIAFDETIAALKTLSEGQTPPTTVEILKRLAKLLAKGPPEMKELEEILGAFDPNQPPSQIAARNIGWVNGAEVANKEARAWGAPGEMKVQWLPTNFKPNP